jgi:hypothetical protein
LGDLSNGVSKNYSVMLLVSKLTQSNYKSKPRERKKILKTLDNRKSPENK